VNNNRNKKRKTLIFQRLRGVLTIFLLFLYILSFETKEIHKILHHHQESLLHSPQQEEDPCHRKVFHHDENACKHKTHVTASEKCSLCELAVHKEHWAAKNNTFTTIHHDSVLNNTVIEFLTTDLSIHLSSRAPPMF
jgi:hypothetical protein